MFSQTSWISSSPSRLPLAQWGENQDRSSPVRLAAAFPCLTLRAICTGLRYWAWAM